jgi:hypothetical protein
VTAAPAPVALWHNDVRVGGVAYPTRNHAPHIEGDTDACLKLTATQLDYLRAIHEAGHAITVLTGQGHLHSAEIVKGVATTEHGGVTYACNLADGHAYAIYSAAGERAVDRWLYEAGLWTPERAVANEVGAHGDRASFLAINPHVGFGDKEVDYLVVHDLADEAIDHRWREMLRVADALVQQVRLDGDEIADLVRIPNGPHRAGSMEGAQAP